MQSKSFFKSLIIVGTVAAVCAFATFYGRYLSPKTAVINISANIEVEQAFIQYIAKYGKSYSSKEETLKRFEAFSENFKMIQAHNEKSDALH